MEKKLGTLINRIMEAQGKIWHVALSVIVILIFVSSVAILSGTSLQSQASGKWWTVSSINKKTTDVRSAPIVVANTTPSISTQSGQGPATSSGGAPANQTTTPPAGQSGSPTQNGLFLLPAPNATLAQGSLQKITWTTRQDLLPPPYGYSQSGPNTTISFFSLRLAKDGKLIDDPCAKIEYPQSQMVDFSSTHNRNSLLWLVCPTLAQGDYQIAMIDAQFTDRPDHIFALSLPFHIGPPLASVRITMPSSGSCTLYSPDGNVNTEVRYSQFDFAPSGRVSVGAYDPAAGGGSQNRIQFSAENAPADWFKMPGTTIGRSSIQAIVSVTMKETETRHPYYIVVTDAEYGTGMSLPVYASRQCP